MQPNPNVRAQVAPLSKLQLSLEARELPNLDVLSKTDGQVFVYMLAKDMKTWNLIGKTEVYNDNLNPKWATTINIDYYFEEQQRLKFTLYDIDKPGSTLEEKDYIGEVQCQVADIVGAKGSRLTRGIVHPRRRYSGVLIVTAEELSDLKMAVRFNVSGTGLDKKDILGKSDPFLTISKSTEGGTWTVVHRTEYIRKTLDPVWRTFDLSLAKLNNGDMNRVLLFQVFDWNKSGKEDFIGQFTASLADIQRKRDWDLINPHKQKKKSSYRNSGVLHFRGVDMIKEHSFLDYILGGTEINLMVAIDYTASNGNPAYANSLHYQSPYEPNEYAKAILAVGEILAAYDSDNMFPVYGFGAKMPNGQVSHCFPVNGNPNAPEVRGVQGILEAYKMSFQTGLTLYGPTNFSQIIRNAAERGRQLNSNIQDVQSYLILLIITDGEITDLDQTIAEVVEASYLPISIVIVGVGNADFGKMEILDGDDGLLRSGSRMAERDIVQFVPFRNYTGQHYSRLAADTLAEIPDQFVGYMKKRGIVPRPPPSADQIAAMQGQQIASIQRQMMQSQYIQTQGQGQPGTTTVTTTTVNTNMVPGPVVAQPMPGLSRAPSMQQGPVVPMPQQGMPMNQMGQPGMSMTQPNMNVQMTPQQQQPVVGYMQPNNNNPGQGMQLPNIAIGYQAFGAIYGNQQQQQYGQPQQQQPNYYSQQPQTQQQYGQPQQQQQQYGVPPNNNSFYGQQPQPRNY